MNYGTKVRVRYKGDLIEGIIVGYPKDSRDRFCLESPQLDVIKKEYIPTINDKFNDKKELIK